VTGESSVGAFLAGGPTSASGSIADDALPILRVETLSVSYGDAVAVRDVSFEVKKGSIVALLGSNGAGKTTTVLTIAGARRPRGGKVIFKGEDVTGVDCKPLVERGLSLVPEGRLVFPRMTVDEHLRIGALNRRAAVNLNRNRDRVFALFPRLAERRRQLGASMSGGEQQMLAIARGLMAEPEVLILDEPSLGLSPKLVSELFGLIRRLHAEGMTVILVEQNVKQSLQIADFAYVLEKGRVVRSGPGLELLGDPLVQKAYLGH
jgi:branched-chain amino acid transport system ATP-binding protein